MSNEWVTIDASDGSGQFKAYVSRPASGHGPAIVAIQEIFGVNEGMREICQKLSEAGYVAICPDLFWRQEPGIELTDKTEEEWQKAFALYNGFDVDKGVEDIQAAIHFARHSDFVDEKVGAVGYCLGGLLAYLTATRTDADACIGYYGVGIQDHLTEIDNLQEPLMLHIAGGDEFVPPEAQAAVHKALDDHPLVTLYDYPGLDHAFARPDGIHFDGTAADLANNRSLDFFNMYLS